MIKILVAVLLFTGCAIRSQRANVGRNDSAATPVHIQGKNKPPGKNNSQLSTTLLAPGPAVPPLETSVPAQEALAKERQGDFLGALKDYVGLSAASPSKQQQEYFRLKSLETTENRLSEDDLDKVSSDSDYGFIRGHALFRLGELSLQRRDTSGARRYFSSVISFLPDSDIAARSQDYISQIESIKYVEPKTIGVILPLSGKTAPTAQRALRAFEIGLGLQNKDSNFKLAVMDSEGNPDNARRAVERLVKEDSAIAIVGGLSGKTASAEVSKADELGVPTIVLSQKSGLTDIGPTIFRNSLTSEMQVHQLVHTAMSEFGFKRFAILYPNDAYGTEYANIFWDEVLARGGTISAVQTYNPKETDFRSPVQRLVGTYYIEARMAEYKFRAKDLKLSQKNKSIRAEEHLEDLLPPLADFDAIFIPDSPKTLGQIAAFLSYSSVKNIKLLGTNLWNSPGLSKRAGNFSNNLLFVDGILQQEERYKRSNFVQEYRSIFGEDPGLIEVQAYDSALILRQTILSGATSREELSRRLSSLRKFPGSLGPLDMSKSREILRPILSLTLNKDGLIVPQERTISP